MAEAIFRFLAAVGTCFALAAPLQAGAYDQWWHDFNVGPLDSFGILALGGSSLAMPGVTSNTAGWTEFGNSTAAFATFADTTDLYFNVHILSSPAEFAVFSWYKGVMKDSALLNTSNVVIAEPYVGPPLPFDMYSADSMAQFKVLAAPVPEPGTYAMLLAGLAAIAVIARRTIENRQAASRPLLARSVAAIEEPVVVVRILTRLSLPARVLPRAAVGECSLDYAA